MIDICEDFDDTLIIMNTEVLDIINLKKLLDCEVKWERDVLHCNIVFKRTQALILKKYCLVK